MEMASGSGFETKSVLVSVFGLTFSTPEDEHAKVNSVSLQTDQTNNVTDYTKSRLEAVFGPEFYSEPETSAAPENFQLDLSHLKSSSLVDNPLIWCESICDSETSQHLKRTGSSSVLTSASEYLSPESSSDSLVTGCQIVDEFTPVEKLVSSLEDQCNEAKDTTQLIPVMERVRGLERRVRMSRSEGLSPTPGQSPTRPAGQDLSQFEQRLLQLTEKDVVSKEEFVSFRRDMVQILGRISDEVHCHHKFQMQVHQRVIPRIILCSKRKGTRQKILKTLTRGVKSVRLHMLCEQEGEEHKVHDAPGCELHLKEGETWESIYPFLNHGLRVLESVTQVAMRMSGVGENLVPSAHAWLQEFHSKLVQPNATYNTSQTPQAAAAQAAASKGAEQWLVKHLTGRDMMQDFGLQRMVFEQPNGSQPEGSIVWLCKEHAENGKDSHMLTYLPTLG